MGDKVLKLGDVVPNFHADSTQGPIDFHSWLEDGWVMGRIKFFRRVDYIPDKHCLLHPCFSWALLLSRPADYTPDTHCSVLTTPLLQLGPAPVPPF